MEIIRVPDILVYRGGSLHSLRGQQIVKGGELHTFGNGSGMVKDGKLYVLDREDYVVRMETGKRSVSISMIAKESMTLEWGDGVNEQCNVGANTHTHEYTDIKESHIILIKGTAGALTRLDCGSNQLSSVDVTRCINLAVFSCPLNLLTSLDVSKNIYLEELECPRNLLTALDVSKNINLTGLFCYENQLSQLDIRTNTSLVTIRCERNQLTALDVSQNRHIEAISCENNRLATLDVNFNLKLLALNRIGNPLDIVNLANTLPDRSGKAAGILHCKEEEVVGIESICQAKNWRIDISM